jgi:hypothetical protein
VLLSATDPDIRAGPLVDAASPVPNFGKDYFTSFLNFWLISPLNTGITITSGIECQTLPKSWCAVGLRLRENSVRVSPAGKFYANRLGRAANQVTSIH